MEERKYIDRLYQEKFKDFEAAPREDLWNDIELKLRQKKRRPAILPLWRKIAGAAAAVLLILLIGDWLNTQPKHLIVNNEEEVLEQTDNEIKIATAESASGKTSGIPGDIEPNQNRNRRTITETSPEISSLQRESLQEIISNPSAGFSIQESQVERETSSTEMNAITRAVEENGLSEPLAQEINRSKIELSTHAAPLYYGNLKSGNFIDPRFNSNSSQGAITYSYGINIAYAISDKLKIRSGVNKISLSHNTNDIALHSVMDPHSIASINYRDDLGVRTVNGDVVWKGSPEPVASAMKKTVSDLARGDLNQRLGFIEVPVELEYVLIDNKVGLNLIGGASTLFLDENRISVSSGEIAKVLGQANNLNEISFSTNIGVGLNYNITEKFLINLEPMFKYQINTFDAATGTYQPYYIAVYSGFSFKF